jgi:hypothetical protein
MKLKQWFKGLFAPLMVIVLIMGSAMSARADIVYDNIPSSLADNYPSLGYQATQTDEFGDRISLTNGGLLNNVTFTLSSWARSEDYNNATSWAQDLTLNVYSAGSGNLPGTLLGTITQNFNILFRPTGWTANGLAQNVTFNTSSLGLLVPTDIVIGLAFNTQSYGTNPIGTNGPWNSLNFAVNTAGGGGVTTGSNPNLDDVMWNTHTAGWYTDGGAGGVNILRQDTNWTGFTPMIRVDVSAVPLPKAAWMGLGLAGFAGMIGLHRRRKLAA